MYGLIQENMRLAYEGAEGDDGAQAVHVAAHDLDGVQAQGLGRVRARTRFRAQLVDKVGERGGVSVGAALKVQRAHMLAVKTLEDTKSEGTWFVYGRWV